MQANETTQAATDTPTPIPTPKEGECVGWGEKSASDLVCLGDRASITLTFEAVSYQDTMSSPFLSLSPERYLKASLLVEMGEYERALPILSSFSETSFFDEVFVAPAHFLRGEAFTALGQPEEAAEHYRRFIEMWQDCGVPLCSRVEDAQKRLDSQTSPSG